MFTNLSVRREIREFFGLAIPLISAQVAQSATGFVDTVMMGWLGQEYLAGGGLAAMTFMLLLVTATGLVVGISPLIAEAYGSGYRARIQKLTGHGIWLTLLVTLPIMLLLGQIERVIEHLGQSAITVTLASKFLGIMLWGFLPALMFALLKSVVSSLSHPKPIMVIVVIGTLFNAIANYILGFGKLGFPALGIAGIAWASVLSQWLMLLALIIYILKDRELRSYQLFGSLYEFELKTLRDLIKIGSPIAVSFSLEIGLFTATTYLMGALGIEVLAAHQIVLQTISLIFMVPLGMSFATTIRVGQWYGQQNSEGVERAAYVSMWIGGIFMTGMAIILLVFPRSIFSLYLDVDAPENAKVIALATSMNSIGAISQILDGVQTNAAGALRGLQDTRIPMLLSFAAFWGVGLSSGYFLGFHFGLGGVGLWIGQFLGIAMSAVVFLSRFRQLIRLPIMP